MTRAVLVTGASSGIGWKITENLAAEGHCVYAGARKESDIRALGTIRNVHALRLDVTSTQDIAAAVSAVMQNGRGLYGLVNNAGVATFGPIVNCNDKEFDLVMAANVYGPYRITKAFAPLIVAEKGRVVTIGSISGILAPKNVGVYSMSKHAIEGFIDALALEMEPFGVHVSVIEPGKFNTKLVENSIAGGADARSSDLSECNEPDEVAAAVVHALFEPKPKRRYLVVSDENEAQRTIRKQIVQLLQLNEGHAYTYDRDEIMRMLDEEFANSHPRTRSSRVQGRFTPVPEARSDADGGSA